MLIAAIVILLGVLVTLILFLAGVIGKSDPKPSAPDNTDKFSTEQEELKESSASQEEIIESLPKLSQKNAYVVGEDVLEQEFTEFYFTRSGSTFPPYYQRFRFFAEDGKHYMYHEKREGDTWPLTEKHITVSGTIELSDEQWQTFWNYIKGGTVQSRVENLEDGGDGPWMYLYWLRDPSDFQEFRFDDYNKVLGFEDFCYGLIEGK